MAVAEVGELRQPLDGRPAGVVYAVVTADSFDAAETLRQALAPLAGLTDDEWRDGWSETPERLFTIRIYPEL